MKRLALAVWLLALPVHAQTPNPDIEVFLPTDDVGAPARDPAVADAGIARAATDAAIASPGALAADAGDASASEADGGVALDAAVPDLPEEPPLPPEHRPRIALTVTPRTPVALGDVVTIEMRVVVPAGDEVTVPEQSLAPFEIHRRSVRTERTDDGHAAFVFHMEVLAFEIGEHELGPIRLRVVTESGLVGSASTDAVRVTVRSLLGNEPNAQPKPPTRPVPVMEENPVPKYVAYALLAMLLGAILALVAHRIWSRRPKPLPPPPPPRPAWEVAIERLDGLRHDRHAMLEEGRIEAWTDAVSDTIRSYLGARYGFDGLDMTTDEIVSKFASLRVGVLSVGELQVFLGDADLVKFAQASFTAEQADALLAQAYRIVRATTPIAAPPSFPGGPS